MDRTRLWLRVRIEALGIAEFDGRARMGGASIYSRRRDERRDMGWFVFTLVVIVLVPALLIAGSRISERQKSASYHGTVISVWLFTAGAVAVLLFWGVVSVSRSTHQIETGHIGLVYTFGKITNQRGAGWALTAPWQSIQQANIQTQSVRPETDCPGVRQCMAAASKQSQNVFISTVLNFHVDPENIQKL